MIILLAFSNISLSKESDFSLSISMTEKENIPDIFLPSIFAGYAKRDALNYLKEFERLGFVRLEIESIITASKNMDDYKQRLNKKDSLIKAITNKGGKVILVSAKVPLWLSSNPSRKATCGGWRVYEASPPRDYEKYAEMVYHTVNHFNSELGMDIYYEVWSEPDLMMDSTRCMWLGSQDEMIELIKHFVLGAKKADPKAKVVTPSVSGWLGSIKYTNNELAEKSIMYQLIKSFSKTRMPELNLQRIPIDFISFHSFDTRPILFPKIVKQIRQWLDNYGYHNTGIIVSEWNGHLGNLPKNASYYLSMIKSMSESGITGQTFASLQDFQKFESGGRNFGMVTKHGTIKKPVFHAMKLLSMLKGRRIETFTDSPTIDAVATYDGDKIYILVWNYIGNPVDIIMRNTSLSGYTEQILEEYGLSKKEVKDFIVFGKPIKKFLPQRVTNTLNESRQMFLNVKKIEKTNQIIRLNLGKLFNKALRYKRYLIDSSHSNAFYHAKKAVKSRQSRTEAIKEAKKHQEIEKVEDRILKNSDKVFIQFEPDSIHLIIIDSVKDTS